MTHVKDANAYIADVLSDKIDACEWVKKACQRQAHDLEKKDFQFKFNKSKANRVCNFVELLPHVKGIWAGKRVALEPWQKFILTTIFGWVDKKTGYRRYRTVYIEVPRKNGKSFLTSAVAVYMLVADKEIGAEIYSVASTKEQAMIVFRTAQQMVRKSKALREKFGIEIGAHNLHVLSSSSKFESLAAEGSTLDGLNIHFASNDELHAHKNRMVYDVIETSTGARAQSLVWNITTAGFNRSGICFELRTYLNKILNKIFADESLFGIIYTIDEKKDKWTQEKVWKKANPNYNVSVFPNDIARLCKKAKEMSSAQNNFLTKRLNCWVNADTAWMNMIKWHECVDASLSIDDFEGKLCFVGVDLASKIDIAAVSLIFPDDYGEGYTLFLKYYLPEECVFDKNYSSAAHYDGWAKEGFIDLTPGNMIDQDYIKEDLIHCLEKFYVKEIAYDPWQAAKLSAELGNAGAELVEIRPTVQNFSNAMKMFEATTNAKKLKHTGCPVMSWMVSNVVAHADKKDNIYPNKEKSENKIDGVIATLMALNRYICHVENESIYAERGMLVV